MNIPKAFTVGNVRYTVTLKPNLPRNCWGRTWLDGGVVEIATHPRRKARQTTGYTGLNTTFWHEATHAILYSMGNPLYKDEAFVNAFSIKLGQLIESAEF